MINNNALDLWGITRTAKFVWILIVVSIIFVVIEAQYNIDLLNSISDPNTDRSAIADLSERGKLLASLGITWALGKSLLKFKPALLGLLLFFISSFAVFQGLDALYAKVIHDLEPETKVQGFNLFAYRQDILTGSLSDPDIPTPKEQPVISKILMGSFPIIMLDDRYMLPAQDILQRKASDKKRQAIGKAEKQWPSYQKQNNELNSSYNTYIAKSKEAIKFKSWGGVEKFKKKSGGMSPNPRATRGEFIVTLKNSNHPHAKKTIDHESRVIAENVNGEPVYGRDLPYFLNHGEYIKWFENLIKANETDIFPTIENVENFEGIHDINSAVFLPPMAIITSLLSAVMNFISVIVTLTGLSLCEIRSTKPIGDFISKFSSVFISIIMIALISVMPSHVFIKNTPLYDLENKMHSKVGFAGKLWSRLSNLQKKIL